MAAYKVLVIEDENSARDGLGSLLAEEGYTVRTAASGRDGLRKVQEFRPDTVVCDFFLPDIDGLQVLRAVRETAAEVTFIMVTAGCGSSEVERALRQEADHFLDKPVDLARLRLLLRGAVPFEPREPVASPTSSTGKERVYGVR